MSKPVARSLDVLGCGLMLLLCLLWGVQQVGTKIATQEGLLPLLQAGLRSCGAALLLCGWVVLRDGAVALRGLLKPDRTLVPGLLVGAIFTLEFAFLFSGIARTTASHAVLLLYTAPFFTAFGAHLFVPGERLTAWQVAGLVLAFCGVVVATGGGLGFNVGDALVLAGAASWGATTVTIRATTLSGEPAARVLLYQLLPSAVALTAAGLADGEAQAAHHASAFAWAALAYQTVVVAFVSYLVWFWLLTRYSARPLSAFTLLTPLIGIAASALMLGEPVTPALLAGFALVAAGLRLVNGKVTASAPRRA